MTMADIRLANRCGVDLGSKPWWMSPWQYDPCECDLPRGHNGGHECEHTRAKAVSDGGSET